MQIRTYDSPVAKLSIATHNQALIAISFTALDKPYLDCLITRPSFTVPGHPETDLERQLDLYFSGKVTHFSIALELHGTPFQQKVWEACARIPFGETRSYAELATMAGHPKAIRAVGTALSRNPIPIIIPCHRVLRSDGSLGGFTGGLDVKQALLDLEK